MEAKISEVLFWTADNLEMIKPFAYMILATIVIVCIYFFVIAYGENE
jgi:hypothetical protein